MRVYLPTTLPGLTGILRDRSIPPGTGYAVTPALREWYASGDSEELEYAAMQRAARACLALLAADAKAARRRVVLAADVPDDDVAVASEENDPAAVSIAAGVSLSAVRAGHVDPEDFAPTVARALAEPDDDFLQGEVEDSELLWYANQELPDLQTATSSDPDPEAP